MPDSRRHELYTKVALIQVEAMIRSDIACESGH